MALVVVWLATTGVVRPHVAGASSPTSSPTFVGLADHGARVLEQDLYTGAGTWRLCLPDVCGQSDVDWGADNLTYDLFLRWKYDHDPATVPIMRALASDAYRYQRSTYSWSDVPMWDAIADAREYEVTGEPLALQKAERAFKFVYTYEHGWFAQGACPSIDFQEPNGASPGLKTLETDSNFVKAALLLFQLTKKSAYLRAAEQKYAAIRRYFLSTSVPLYTVYVLDDGGSCRRIPGQYFTSVNGNMIWDGVSLWKDTGVLAYRQQAVETAAAVAQHLSDGNGILADLQAEDDVEEPLVEGMLSLAEAGYAFARTWLLTSASAAASSRSSDGLYGRFFDGPAGSTTTAWQTNGGLALEFIASHLAPNGFAARPGYWSRSTYVKLPRKLHATPVTISFDGSGIAIVGTIGARCCRLGHAEVQVDGFRTFDKTGIWQNDRTVNVPLAHSVLFAWRWTRPGHHTVEITQAPFNKEQGGSYFEMIGYEYVR